ncbi:MAG: bifunctional phosphoribosyl-AMP cyclohydrolase/phosphoribosyl-ATP diphosphatase HisIE, partial [Candidatus Melainabacteria bacterium]|nr:bifunctional phosphoribosyl-AMP cyclohydrolase/phosphoribosyl-ATP diphosphatase HisIE [Candidatus Melainabacteria bacterium]
VAIDSKDDMVVNKGWTAKTNRSPSDLVKELEPYCCEFLFTDVNREGLMKGMDFGKIKKLKELTQNKLTAAGGISFINEIKLLEELGVNSQLGMALYIGRIKLDEAFVSLLDFSKNNGFIPTIVQDEQNQVLMLAFSSRESILKTFRERKATYYSRSRKMLWTKGETSGNYQEIIKVRYDCDRDTLLFTVKQNNAACHYGKYSCFGEKKFSFQKLYDVLVDRIKSPRDKSYTSKIATNENKIKQKIKEECLELLKYKDKNNLVWEVSDLFYFIFCLMVKNKIEIKDIENELWRRRR